jgi:hypothetical protein
MDNSVVGYGSNDIGQLDLSPSLRLPSPEATSVASGGFFGCVLRAGALRCSGHDGFKQISDIPTGAAFSSVSAGAYSICGIVSTLSVGDPIRTDKASYPAIWRGSPPNR